MSCLVTGRDVKIAVFIVIGGIREQKRAEKARNWCKTSMRTVLMAALQGENK
jgi:hypothetical protein